MNPTRRALLATGAAAAAVTAARRAFGQGDNAMSFYERGDVRIHYQDSGSGFPLHLHDFAQVWYVLEGECRFGDRTLAEGDMVYMQDPHFEYEMHTEKGCRILFVQYPGPNTGGRPIYDGRFNQTDKPDIEKQDLTR